jgi:hypothetical protein
MRYLPSWAGGCFVVAHAAGGWGGSGEPASWPAPTLARMREKESDSVAISSGRGPELGRVQLALAHAVGEGRAG